MQVLPKDGSATTARLAPWRPSRALLVYGAWLLIAALICGSVAVDATGKAGTPIPFIRVFLTFFEAMLWATVTLLSFWLINRFPPERYTAWSRIVLYLGVGILIVLCVSYSMSTLRRALSGADADRPFSPTSAIGIAITVLTYAGVLATAIAHHYLQRVQNHREAELTLRTQTAQLTAQLADARLRMLRAQLNPHFLFNTLHAISALATRDPARVRGTLAQLSELLRMTLDETGDIEAQLHRELHYIRKYLDLMSLQFQPPLHLQEDIEPATQEVLVPTLLLQPLIENAIIHGLARSATPGLLSLQARRRGQQLLLQITNSAPATTLTAQEGLGLRNTRERLAQLYGSQGYSMQLQHDPVLGQFTVQIVVPLRFATVGPRRAATTPVTVCSP